MPPRASIAVALAIARELVVAHVFQAAEYLVETHARVHVVTLVTTVALAVVTAVKEDWQGEYANILTLPLFLNAL